MVLTFTPLCFISYLVCVDERISAIVPQCQGQKKKKTICKGMTVSKNTQKWGPCTTAQIFKR